MRSVPLVCHESTPSSVVQSVHVHVADRDDVIALRYEVHGDITRLRIPARRPAARVDELWRHTCFEAFLRPDDSAGYLELNFSTSGEWAAYRFSSYRADMAPLASTGAPSISCSRTPSHLTVSVSVSVNIALPRGRARVALSAVIEDDEGRVSYWALAHPPGKPDFHHEAGFVLDY